MRSSCPRRSPSSLVGIPCRSAGRRPDALGKLASRLEVHELVLQLVQELWLDPVDDHQAGLEVAKRLAQQILGGSVAPAEGARRIWWDISRRSPLLEEQLQPFRGLASEWEDDLAHRDEYERDIVEEARCLLRM